MRIRKHVLVYAFVMYRQISNISRTNCYAPTASEWSYITPEYPCMYAKGRAGIFAREHIYTHSDIYHGYPTITQIHVLTYTNVKKAVYQEKHTQNDQMS